MHYAGILMNQIFIMFLLLGTGFVLYKIHMVSAETNKQLTNIVLYVISPAMILDTYQMDFNPQEAKNMMLGFALSIISIMIAILCSKLVYIKGEAHSIHIERFCIIFTNCGFMAIPLTQALFGKLGVFYCNTYITIFNIFLWTYGVYLMNHSDQKNTTKSFLSKLKPFITPMMISILCGLIMYFCKIRFPQPVKKAVKYIADMNTPMAMLVSGAFLAQSDLWAAIKKLRVYYVAILKCFLLPLLILPIFAVFSFDRTLLFTILIVTACPTASNALLFASRYDQDVERASNVFALSTFMSLISLPIIIAIAQMVI